MNYQSTTDWQNVRSIGTSIALRLNALSESMASARRLTESQKNDLRSSLVVLTRHMQDTSETMNVLALRVAKRMQQVSKQLNSKP